MIAASTDAYAEEMRDKVWPRMSTLQLFVEPFDQNKARGAAVGAEDEEGVCPGLTAATLDAFSAFHRELHP